MFCSFIPHYLSYSEFSDLRLPSVSDDTMYDDEQCLESVATTNPLHGTAPSGTGGGGSDEAGDGSDDADTADDVSVEELDGGTLGLDNIDLLNDNDNVVRYNDHVE